MRTVEAYEIYKDKRFFASWQKGDPARYDVNMDRSTFEREYESCVAYWRSQGSKAVFEMRISRYDSPNERTKP